MVWSSGGHCRASIAVDVPCVGRVEFVLKFGLTGYECVHFVGIVEHVGVAERLIDFVELGEQVHDRLYAFAHNFDYGLVGVKLRILFEVAHRVARGEHHFALILLVDSCYDFQQRRLS